MTSFDDIFGPKQVRFSCFGPIMRSALRATPSSRFVLFRLFDGIEKNEIFCKSLACGQSAKIRHFFWERINSKKDGGMSAIAFLFQDLFVAMTPSYDSILRRERYFNILSSPRITGLVSRVVHKYRFVQNHDSRCPRDARQRHRQPFSGRGKTDESANEAEPRLFS